MRVSIHRSRQPPWRYGNRFRLLEDGERFFPRMLEAIDAAREYVLLEMYLVESGSVADRFVDALSRAASRGVRVAVVLDGFGSLGLRAADRARLTESGVELRFYNALGLGKRLRNLMRDHRKLLLVDGQVAFVGGAGLTDDFHRDGQPDETWRELMVEIEGPVVEDWQRAFDDVWRRAGGRPDWPQRSARAFPDGAAGRVVLSDGWHRSPLADSVAHRLRTARERAWVMSAYFVPSRRFRKLLRRAAYRGVDVRVLVPGPRTDHPAVRRAARRFYGKLLRNGVRIFEYQPRVLHGKMVICDDWVSIGSSNLDRWGFEWNLEANQEIEHRPFANLAAHAFVRDCREAEELDPRTWHRRGRMERLRERIAGAIDRVLQRWRRPRHP